MDSSLKIRLSGSKDTEWVDKLMNESWGGLPLVIRGEKYYPSSLDGIIAENEQGIAGFLFYEIRGNVCEIIVFEVFDKFKGTGSTMLDKLKEIAKNSNCHRLYLMTTNDNLDAFRFYQRRGFTICAIHIDSVKISRKIKPTIGMIGDHGIPVRDEIDLELLI
jgi:GNAT superfamily N-acetyltransferase